MSSRIAVLLLALLLGACGPDAPSEDDPTTDPDAGAHLDPDAGETTPDAGSTPDAGEELPDAGDAPDAGEETPDAGPPPDTTAPTILMVNPPHDALGLPPSFELVVTFSEPILRESLVVEASPSLTLGNPVFEAGDRLVRITLSGLALSTRYTLTIDASDLAGNALIQATHAFTTAGDTTRPTVVSTNPAHSATGVSGTPTVRVVFSEPMDETATTAAITVNPVRAGTTSWSGNELTWTASSAFPPGITVTFTVGTGARDHAGNTLASAKVVSFRIAGTADTMRPLANSVQPPNTAQGIAPTVAPVVGFNEPMDRATVEASTTFTANGITVAHTKSWNETGTQLTLTPAAPIAFGAPCVVGISVGAKDLSGNALQVPVNLQFKIIRELELAVWSVAAIDGSVRNTGSPTVYLTERNLAAGDQANNTEWWRGFISFDLSGIEGNPTLPNIVSAELEITQTARYGNISRTGIGPVNLVSVDYGATLDAADLDIAALTHANATLPLTDADCNACRKTIDVLDKVRADWSARSQRGSRCQFRIQTATQQTNNNAPDWVGFFSGESSNGDSRPRLRVRYRVP